MISNEPAKCTLRLPKSSAGGSKSCKENRATTTSQQHGHRKIKWQKKKSTLRFYLLCLFSVLLLLKNNVVDLMKPLLDTTNNSLSPSLPLLDTTKNSLSPSLPVLDTTKNSLSSLSSSKQHADFTIIVLTMNRLPSLKRLVESLKQSDYRNDTVDLIFKFDQPSGVASVDFAKDVQWPFGSVQVQISNTNMGLRQAWLEAWQPQTLDDRAIILEDDITVSPLWYQWIQTMYDHYGHRHDLAGFSLQRQQLVPLKERIEVKIHHNDNEPFLYNLVGSIGFVPNAQVWRDFIEWTKCSLCKGQEQDVSIPGLITSDWYKTTDQRMMWTQHFTYFTKHYNLFTLYQHPSNSTCMGAHWREKGAHFGSTLGPDFQIAQQEDFEFKFPQVPTRYDWGFRPVPVKPKPRTVVMSSAVGYTSLSNFENFVGNLRKFYQGDVKMMVSNTVPEQVLTFLNKHDIDTHKTEEGRSLEEFNKFRFSFYSTNCLMETYDYCLALDFRDVIFQGNPFPTSLQTETADVLLYAHSKNWSLSNDVGQYHVNLLNACHGEQYRTKLLNKPVINAGGILGTPFFFLQMLDLMLNEDLKGCNGQVLLNIGIYGGLIQKVKRHKVSIQGIGIINNVANGDRFTKDSYGRYGGIDCFLSPIVHQFDSKNLKPPLNEKCSGL